MAGWVILDVLVALVTGFVIAKALAEIEWQYRLDMAKIDYEHQLRQKDIRHDYDMEMLRIDFKYGKKES